MSINKTREIINASLKNTANHIVRHHKYAWVFTLVAVIAVSGVYFKRNLADAATYTFTQASWAGVMDSTTATHTSNQTGWTKYSAKDAGVTAGATVALTGSSYTATDGKLSGLWHMDNNWNDSSGNGNTGTATGATFGTAKLGTYAGSFNGTTDYTKVDSTVATGLTGYTMEAWVNSSVSGTDTDNIFLSTAGSGGFTGHMAYLNRYGTSGGNKWHFSFSDGTPTQRSLISDDTIINGQWYHIVATNNGTNQYLYVNGVRQASTGSFSGFNSTTIPGLTIGAYSRIPQYPFAGKLDEVAIYSRALTAQEIALQYNAGTGKVVDDFQAGTNSSTAVSGTGTGASVGLAINGGTGAEGAYSCTAASGALISTYVTGTNPYGVAFDSSTNSVWVANATAGNVQKFNASTGTSLGTYVTGTNPNGVAFDSSTNSIWVANRDSNNVTKLNASNGAFISNYVVGTSPYSVAFDSSTNSIWVANYASATVTKIRASDGVVLGTYATGGGPIAIAFDSSTNSVWTANYNANTATKIRASDGVVLGTYATGTNPYGVAFDSFTNSVWTANVTSNTATKIRASDGVVLGTYAAGVNPYAITFDSFTNSVWTANYNSATVTKLRANDGTILGTYATGSGPIAIAFDSSTNSVWITDNSEAKVTKLYVGCALSGTHNFTTFNISAGATVDGSAFSTPLTINATGNVTIAGTLNMNGGTGNCGICGTGNDYGTGGGAGGVGGRSGGDRGATGGSGVMGGGAGTTSGSDGGGGGGGTTASGSPGLGTAGGSGGASGGGYGGYNSGGGGGGSGGAGGNAGGTNGANGTGGDAFVDEAQGSGGGGGSGLWIAGGGGGGGGYLKIISSGSISNTGTINANGGSGGISSGDGGINSNTGGGGGGGGRINLVSLSIANTGIIQAIGGNGGSVTSGGTVDVGAGGGGGGGRINLAAFSVTGNAPNVAYGNGGTSYTPGSNGGIGTSSATYPSGTFPTSGTFTSATINLGAVSSFSNLSFNLNQPTNTDLDVQVATSASSSGPWTYYNYDGSTTAITSAASTAKFSKDNTNCTVTGTNPYAVSCPITTALATAINGKQYIRYKAYLSTTNTAVTPTLNDITFNYTQYPTSGTLTSSKYDSGSAGNTISGINWTGSATSSTAVIQFQMRVASTAVGLDSAVWQGPTTSSDYFTTGYQTITNSNLTGTTGRQFFQYKAYITSLGNTTPILTGVTVRYVVNAPPTVSSVTASQSSTGTVTVGYSIADTDSTSETITLQYCSTGSTCTVGSDTNWVNATTVTGNVGAGVTLGTGKSLVWTPATDYAGQYNATEMVRVKANDGDAANNLGYGISSAFFLDTTAPVVTVANLNSSGTQDIVNLTTTDNSTITYRLCNTADFVACASWTSITSGAATPVNWTATGAPNAETVYLQVRDAYGNVTARTLTAPAMPTNLLAADVSNPSAQSFGETLSWLSVPNATSYRVYSAYTSSSTVAPTSYTLLATPSTNVYQHTITTATTSAYWYRVASVNSNGDISNFTTETTIGDVPDSFGTTLPDTTAPTIDPATISVPATTLKNTSAVISFTTNELAIAKVYYGTINRGTACSSYGTPVTTSSYVTAQSVSLTGLTASTPYYYCLKAVDTLGNPLVDPNTGVDGSAIAPLTTAGGPTITVAPQPNPFNDTSATIIWTTSTSSDSFVYYATNASVTNPKTAGTATLVDCVSSVCQHSVGIANLVAGTKYYYYVKSTDGLGNTTPSAIDNFTTTIDITPPVITGIATPVISSDATVIVWQTDEPATSQVLWGGTTGNRSKYTTTDDTKSIYHVVTLSSATTNSGTAGGTNALTPSTSYYFVVKSADVAGNIATSAEQTVATVATGNVTIVAVSVTAAPVTTASVTPDTTAPTVSGVKVGEITPFGATVTFNTDEDTVNFVDYGKDTSYGDSAGDKVYGTTHTIKLRGLTLGTEYHIKVSAIDKAGNTGTSEDQTFKTTFLSENLKDMTNVENIEQFQKEIEDTIASILPSLIPPFVGRPQITDITEDGATVSFTTNIKAFPVVGFAEENLFDETKENPYTGETSDTTEKRVNHTLALMGLKPNTTYHIQARAFSLPQVIGKSKDYTFTTKASKIVASIIERKKDSFSVVWTTLEPTSSIVEYKNLSSGRIARVTDDVKKTSHAMKIENLPSATSYEVNVSGINEKGNIVEAGSSLSVTTSKDVTPPTLSGFKVANALVPGRTDRIQTIISWTTDEPSDSVVYYEEGVGTTGDTKELANNTEVPDLSTNHNVILSSLKPGAIYRIKITSTDDSGNIGAFGPRTVITPRQTESITDIIFKNFEDSFKFLRNM